MQVSVIIPAYNEDRRLPITLTAVYRYLYQSGLSFEIIVVDDGSYDDTAAYVEEFAQQYPGVRLLSYAPNRGKGYAVRTGMLAARGDYLLMNDADGSSPIEEMQKLLVKGEEGFDVVIGSRATGDPEAVIKALPHRKYIGNTFNLIVQKLILPGIKDTQCGFKLFRRQAAHDIFSVSRLNGYAFDVEILYIARLRDYKIAEIAINWANVEGSKVNVLTDSPRMLAEVLRITFSAWFGGYRKLAVKRKY
ncbi:MAG: glycosyl transferase family 2 [Cyanobacteria bacterium PR.023]|nr:glycosyl transferase family 2 [Cyanobacteria bacterium PR.023]